MKQIVDLSFRIKGYEIPYDYSYPLFSSLCHIWNGFHENQDVGIHPINGSVNGQFLSLDESSRLIIRCPERSAIDIVSHLSDRTIGVSNYPVQVGQLEDSPKKLSPFHTLVSRIVTLKRKVDPQKFIEKIDDIFTETLSEKAKASILHDGNGNIKQVIQVKSNIIVGFSIIAWDLSDEDSLTLQAVGIGGRRRFGCGIFNPSELSVV